MATGRATNLTKGTVLCERLEIADTISAQSRGLLGRDRLEESSGMLFEGSRIIPFMWMHMFFMRFPIDIVFLNKHGRVIAVNQHLKPWRLSSLAFGARRALELEAGMADLSATEIGDQIEIELVPVYLPDADSGFSKHSVA